MNKMILMLLLGSTAYATEITGKVVGVYDGDTSTPRKRKNNPQIICINNKILFAQQW